MIDKRETANVVLAFLKDPTDRRRFDDFFAVSLCLARSYIALRLRRGTLYVPTNEFPLASATEDCACECLGTLFASKPGRPFYLILDYFRPRVTEATPPDRICAILQGMIAGHIDQELLKFNPQGIAIRRAIVRAMREETFEEIRLGGRSHWALRTTAGARRESLPPIDDGSIQSFINTACRRFSDMPGRCREIFDQLDRDDQFQNLIECRRFTSAIIKVLTDHDGTSQSPEPGPQTVFIRKTLHLLSENAVELALKDVLIRQATQRDFSEGECAAFRGALTNLMSDFTQHGEHDLLPGYLKETLGQAADVAYLQRYKYVWETLVGRCKELLREMLREEGLAP